MSACRFFYCDHRSLCLLYPLKQVLPSHHNQKEIFFFEKHINHDWFYEVVGHMDDQFRKRSNAGFTNGISCYGRSETLNLDSGPTDFELTKSNLIKPCVHEHNGMMLTSNPPKYKCIKCNEFYT